MSAAPVTEADLHAYLDAVLPPGARRRGRGVSRRASGGRRARRGLSRTDPGAAPRFRRSARRAGAGSLWRDAGRGAAASPVMQPQRRCCWCSGGAIGWHLHAYNTDRRLETTTWARRAAIAHIVYSPEVRHPVEVGADQEAHLVAWLSKRLGTPLKVPHLGDLGYTLVGGRLLPGERGPVAQFMYQDGKGQRLTLYVRVNADDSRETAFRFAQEQRGRRVLLAGSQARLRAIRRSRQDRAAARGDRGSSPAESIEKPDARRSYQPTSTQIAGAAAGYVTSSPTISGATSSRQPP